jgi:transposase
MLTQESQQAIVSLYQRGVHIREISRILKLSRTTIRRVIRGTWHARAQRHSPYDELSSLVRETFKGVKGNVVRVAKILEEHGHTVPYSTLTRIVRNLDLREDHKVRAGTYTFGPGEEMQHDTSPHQVLIDGKR